MAKGGDARDSITFEELKVVQYGGRREQGKDELAGGWPDKLGSDRGQPDKHYQRVLISTDSKGSR